MALRPHGYGAELARVLERAGVAGLMPLMRRTSSLPDVPADLRADISRLEIAEVLKSGLYLYCGCWDEAHEAADRTQDVDGYFWHGIVHRQEPDAGNARYWFQRAGNHPIFADLAREAARCGYPASSEAWDPSVFIDYCESARTRPGSKEEQVAMEVQQTEWQLLFDHCARSPRG